MDISGCSNVLLQFLVVGIGVILCFKNSFNLFHDGIAFALHLLLTYLSCCLGNFAHTLDNVERTIVVKSCRYIPCQFRVKEQFPHATVIYESVTETSVVFSIHFQGIFAQMNSFYIASKHLACPWYTGTMFVAA